MEIPEGYAVAPVSTDHLVKIAVPVPGRKTPILIEAPKLGWVSPKEARAFQKFATDHIEAAQAIDEWHRANDDLPEDERAPFPEEQAQLAADGDEERQGALMRELKLRWLKPHMKASDYPALSTSQEIPERPIQWIVDQLTAPDDVDPITVGESSASDV